LPIDLDLGEEVIRLPQEMVMNGDDISDLIEEIYEHDRTSFLDVNFVKGKAILATRNKDVDAINAHVMDRFPGEVSPYSITILNCLNYVMLWHVPFLEYFF